MKRFAVLLMVTGCSAAAPSDYQEIYAPEEGPETEEGPPKESSGQLPSTDLSPSPYTRSTGGSSNGYPDQLPTGGVVQAPSGGAFTGGSSGTGGWPSTGGSPGTGGAVEPEYCEHWDLFPVVNNHHPWSDCESLEASNPGWECENNPTSGNNVFCYAPNTPTCIIPPYKGCTTEGFE